MKVIHMPNGEVHRISEGPDDDRVLFEFASGRRYTQWDLLLFFVTGALLGIVALVMLLGLPLPLRLM
jgi:hypothetical protein